MPRMTDKQMIQRLLAVVEHQQGTIQAQRDLLNNYRDINSRLDILEEWQTQVENVWPIIEGD